jgi:hypothetical protein
MKIFKIIKDLFSGVAPERELTEREKTEARRVKRRMEKFPRIKGSPYPMAMRNHLFKEKYNLITDNGR